MACRHQDFRPKNIEGHAESDVFHPAPGFVPSYLSYISLSSRGRNEMGGVTERFPGYLEYSDKDFRNNLDAPDLGAGYGRPGTNQSASFKANWNARKMNWILGIMILSMAAMVLHFFRSESLWERLVALSSMSTKAGLAILAGGVLRGDGAVAFVGVIVLSMGNAGIIIVSYLFRRLKIECR